MFRRLDGIVLLDKPGGMSSNQALQRVRHLLRAEKGGHTGALDPLATGLLPLCFGEATKIAGLLLGANKAYTVTGRLGQTTDTDDAEGEVLRERAVPAIDRSRVEAELTAFIGRIMQRPPIYSALKRGGEPLYAKARRGEQVEVAEREVEVKSIELTALAVDRLSLAVECGSGTYIRSLIRDLGERLGCGAHVEILRRTWVDPFRQPQMVTLDQLTREATDGDQAWAHRLLPLEAGLPDWRRVRLSDEQVQQVRQGRALSDDGGGEAGISGDSPPAEALAVDSAGSAVALMDRGPDGLLRPRRVFVPG